MSKTKREGIELVNKHGLTIKEDTLVFNESGVELFINAYKEAWGYYWPKMKKHIIELVATYPVDIAEFALISGSDEYEEMAKQTLGVMDI